MLVPISRAKEMYTIAIDFQSPIPVVGILYLQMPSERRLKVGLAETIRFWSSFIPSAIHHRNCKDVTAMLRGYESPRCSSVCVGGGGSCVHACVRVCVCVEVCVYVCVCVCVCV